VGFEKRNWSLAEIAAAVGAVVAWLVVSGVVEAAAAGVVWLAVCPFAVEAPVVMFVLL